MVPSVYVAAAAAVTKVADVAYGVAVADVDAAGAAAVGDVPHNIAAAAAAVGPDMLLVVVFCKRLCLPDSRFWAS